MSYLYGLVVFPTLILNLAVKSSLSEPQSAPGLIFSDSIDIPHLWLQKCNQSDFCIDHLVMSMCISSLMLFEEGVCYDQCVLLAKPC